MIMMSSSCLPGWIELRGRLAGTFFLKWALSHGRVLISLSDALLCCLDGDGWSWSDLVSCILLKEALFKLGWTECGMVERKSNVKSCPKGTVLLYVLWQITENSWPWSLPHRKAEYLTPNSQGHGEEPIKLNWNPQRVEQIFSWPVPHPSAHLWL